jgi:hypothetical protein
MGCDVNRLLNHIRRQEKIGVAIIELFRRVKRSF